MSKILLVEYMGLVTHLTPINESKNPNNLVKLRGKIQEANVINGNRRKYPKNILEREITKYNENLVKTRTAMSELDHPDSSIVELKNTSHIITKIWWEGDNVMAELELLNTPSGRIAQAIVEAKIPLGISSRGMGSVKQIDEGTVEVQDDLDLVAFDLVSTPSTPGAYLGAINENKINENLDKSNNVDKYSKFNEIIRDIICNQTGTCVLC